MGGCIIFFLSLDMVLEQMLRHSVTMLHHVDSVIQLME
jgi:hypothetical protein